MNPAAQPAAPASAASGGEGRSLRLRAGAWWRARNRREQVLILLAALAMVAATVELAVLAPQRTARAQAQREIAASLAQLEALRAATELAATRGTPKAGAGLQARRRQAEARIEQAQANLIAPHDMARQLQAIVVRHPQLRVVGIQSLPPKPFEGAAAATLYEHGLRVDVEGRYLDLLAYLEALEHAPYRIFWRSLDMKAEAGVPLTRIEMYTLSKEPVWLRL
jgi:MSHA biogenesis protein MshJ